MVKRRWNSNSKPYAFIIWNFVTIYGLDNIYNIAQSPDGRFIYGSAFNSSAVSIFSRNRSTGALTYVDKLSDGQLMTFVTLYSDQIDVSKIAMKFGGGGHKGAAGFHFPRNDSAFPPGAVVSFNQVY